MKKSLNTKFDKNKPWMDFKAYKLDIEFRKKKELEWLEWMRYNRKTELW